MLAGGCPNTSSKHCILMQHAPRKSVSEWLQWSQSYHLISDFFVHMYLKMHLWYEHNAELRYGACEQSKDTSQYKANAY
jgi:hypothetical protein